MNDNKFYITQLFLFLQKFRSGHEVRFVKIFKYPPPLLGYRLNFMKGVISTFSQMIAVLANLP